ncbi:MAG: hypothetical protein RIS31_1103, partial [Actinomycetota bacterium]
MKKFLRGPILWIALAGFAVFFGLQLGGQSGVTYKSVDTSYGLQLIKDGKAKSVKVYDGSQRVDIELSSEDFKTGSKHVQFHFVYARAGIVMDAIDKARITDGYNDEIESTPWYM